MSLLPFIVIFFLGACVGSFGAVLIENASIQRSFWTGRSHCIGCKKPLLWYELIPLVSYEVQKGKCRICRSVIPRWIWYMEWYMAFLWMMAAMVLSIAGFSPLPIAVHLLLLTWLSLLAIGDIRSGIIPDTWSMPLMVGIFCIVFFVPLPTMLPDPLMMIIGALVGMMFYMVQMILPAFSEVVRRKTYKLIPAILYSPVIFPLWMIAKVLVGEKKADRLFPTLQVFETLPSWVGGGDIRLGIIIGALVGPYDFLFVIMYGYLLGTAYFLLRLVIFRTRIQTLPVAPLLFFGVCIVWCLRIFS